MNEQAIPSTQEYPLKFPRVSLYLRFSSISAILIAILFLIIQAVGTPPVDTGLVSTAASLVFVGLAGTLMFIEILILGATLALSLWRSGAIAWVASNIDGDISSSDVEMLRKATKTPYRNVQTGLPLLTFSLVVALLSFPIGKLIISSFEVGLSDAILAMTCICIGFNMLIEYSHIRLERKYSRMPDSELRSGLALVKPAHSISGIREVLDSKSPDKTPRWLLIISSTLFSLWCVTAILLLIT
ncbi:MAG: hypothetical protein P1Q69_06635 [Candidatus Thorarchaeota archaeon]|nr:hypothetical protein [Candidatus Thorarchaeota archaeon]